MNGESGGGGDVTVGIDIGTTSVKAVAVDAEGRVLERVRIAHALDAPDPDTFRHDPATAWIGGVLAAWDVVSRDRAVAGATVSAMVPSLCGVDAAGRPVTPGLLYGDSAGRQPGSGAGAAMGEALGFARWLAARPSVAGVWPAQAVANHALCGEAAIDRSTAMTLMPLFAGDGWDEDLLAGIGLTEGHMPRLRLDGGPVGSRGSTLIGGGLIDAVAEQVVADASAPGDVLVVCGTTLICWALNEAGALADGLWSTPYVLGGLSALGGASNAGGLFVDRIRAITGDPGADEILAVYPDRIPVWLPYIRGERTPFHDPTLRAELLDLDVGHDEAAVMAAAYEATGFVVRHHLDLAADALEAAGARPRRIVATGGGTRSAAWMQALADSTGLPVDVATEPEGAAIGAAYWSRIVAGLETDLEATRAWASPGRRVEPRPAHGRAADDRYNRFRRAIAARTRT